MILELRPIPGQSPKMSHLALSRRYIHMHLLMRSEPLVNLDDMQGHRIGLVKIGQQKVRLSLTPG